MIATCLNTSNLYKTLIYYLTKKLFYNEMLSMSWSIYIQIFIKIWAKNFLGQKTPKGLFNKSCKWWKTTRPTNIQKHLNPPMLTWRAKVTYMLFFQCVWSRIRIQIRNHRYLRGFMHGFRTLLATGHLKYVLELS